MTPRTDVYFGNSQTSYGNCNPGTIVWTDETGAQVTKFEYDKVYKASVALASPSEARTYVEANIESGIDINNRNENGSYKSLSVALNENRTVATVTVTFDAIPTPTQENTNQEITGTFETLRKGTTFENFRPATVKAQDKNNPEKVYIGEVEEDGTKGTFVIKDVPVGTYTDTITKPGYLPYIYDDLEMYDGRYTRIFAGQLIAGDIEPEGVFGHGIINILDFTNYLRSFTENPRDEIKEAADIFEMGAAGVEGLAHIKAQIRDNLSVSAKDIGRSEKARTMTLANTYYRLTQDKELTVGWIGGSITSNSSGKYKGYDEFFIDYLRENFPDAEINRVNAGLSGTGSSYGIFRADKELLHKDGYDVPDLVFIEFTVNESSRHGGDVAAHYESLIRNIYKANPMADIVCVMAPISGGYKENAEAHGKVAQYYGLPIINVGMECFELNTLVGTYMATSYDNLHAHTAGYEFFNKTILDRLAPYLTGDKVPAQATYEYLLMPEQFCESVFNNPTAIDPLNENVTLEGAWETSGTTGSLSSRLTGVTATSKTAGDTMTFTFTGDAFGFNTASWDDTTRAFEYSIDGGEFKLFNPSYEKLGGWMYVTAELGLEDKEHTVVVRVTNYSAAALRPIGVFPVSTPEQLQAATIPEAQAANYEAIIHAICYNDTTKD